MKKTLFTLFILFFTNGAFAQFSTDTNKILYVDSAVVGGNGSGDSWANAAVSLADALSWARTNETNWASDSLRIYVAKGTYLPKYKADDNTWSANNRDNAFVMIKNVQVYGGFPNGGSAFAARDWNANPTVMSGDIGTLGNTADNAHHVLVAAGNTGNACVDGFVVKEGRADGSGPITVNTQSIDRGNGGGLHTNTSGINISNTSFISNNANHGGAFYNMSSTVNFTNCKIKSNSTQYNGAGGYNNASTAQFVNTELTSNTSSAGNGGAFFNYSNSTVKLTNCLVAKNNALDGGGFYNLNTSSATLVNVTLADNTPNAYTLENSSSLTAKNSIVLGGKSGNANPGTYQNSYVDGASWDGNWGTDGGSNFVSTEDPFINKAASDYRLSTCARAIDAGSNTLYTGEGGNLGTDKDIAGNDRVFNTTIDMGAYENILPVVTPPTVNLGTDITACNDTTVVLDAGNPGMTYLWSNNSTNQTLAVSASGTYWVKVTDPNTGCSSTDTTIVNITDAGLYIVTPVSDTICSGESVSLQCTSSGNTVAYCSPASFAINRYFTNITYSTINNTSGQSSVQIPDYTSDTAYVNVGISNTLSATVQNLIPSQISIFAYIDWNQNGI
ncbi:MAG: hypothetical protein H3C45_11340, partial [Bacteroidia bacterium]|nr:hypothetical protein [Bacteroidia bacterium]